MRFDKEGNAEETHREYSAAAREVAANNNAPLIDLDARSRELIQQMGAANAKLLFMQLDSMEHPNYPAGQKDNTHFNEYGARRMAELVLAEMKKWPLELNKHIIGAAVKN